MKKSFTILEIIFVIFIVFILVVFFINNITSFYLKKNTIFKAKIDIAIIRTQINKNFQNKFLLGKESKYIEVLDKTQINKEGEYLFVGTKKDILIDNIILSSSEKKKKAYAWIKVDKNKYILYINSKNIEFIYDNTNGNFDCKIKYDLCKEINE